MYITNWKIIPIIKFIKFLTRDFLNDIISVISLQNLYCILSMSFCLCNKMNITWQLEDMNLISLHQKQYFTQLLCLSIKNQIHIFVPLCNCPMYILVLFPEITHPTTTPSSTQHRFLVVSFTLCFPHKLVVFSL